MINGTLRYDDDVSLVRKVFPAAEFVWSSDDPVETLGKVTSISFGDDSSLPLKEHPSTTEEVISCSIYFFTVVLL